MAEPASLILAKGLDPSQGQEDAMRDLLRGELVRLTTESPEVVAKAEATWHRDSELNRLGDIDPAHLWSEKRYRERLTRRVENGPDEGYYLFSIRTLDGEQVIGDTMLRIDWSNGDAMMGVMIGDRAYWDRGYGTDAVRLILQFAFCELNLRRVTLGVNGYNARAQRVYEKAGFRSEGTLRGEILREGRRSDGLYMGILREEWLEKESLRKAVSGA